jgi:hypothetical protein
LLPFIQKQDLDSVVCACVHGFKYIYDGEVLHQTWLTLARIASNDDNIISCPSFLIGGRAQLKSLTHAEEDISSEYGECGDRTGGQGRGLSCSCLDKTFQLVRKFDKNNLMASDAMLSMLDFLSSMLSFLVKTSSDSPENGESLEVLLRGLVDVIAVRVMEEYVSIDERVVSGFMGVLADAMQSVPHFAASFAPQACTWGFVETAVRFLREASADKQLREPVVRFIAQLLLAGNFVEDSSTFDPLCVISLDAVLLDVVSNGSDTEHGPSFVEVSVRLCSACVCTSAL